MRILTGMIIFIVCVPLIGTVLIKPDNRIRREQDHDTSVINESFAIAVEEENGTFYYKPEILTEFLMYRAIPEDTAFSSSEDYIVKTDQAYYDPEQEYLKALAIVCRSSVVSAWEAEQCPMILDYAVMQMDAGEFYRIIQGDSMYTKVLINPDMLSGSRMSSSDNVRVKLNEIEQAVDDTKGAVITRDGKVITAPFFTTSPSDMLVLEVGDGVGFSLNYAYELAVEGMGFYEILKYFFDDIRVTIYE